MNLHSTLSKLFIKGLSIVLPIAVALYVMVWMIRSSEGAVKGILTTILPPGAYIPGMGLLTIIALVFVAGLLMYPWLTRKLFRTADKTLRKIPLFGNVYAPVKDLMGLVGGDMEKKLGRPVMVTVPNTNMETLGFVTREGTDGLPEGFLPDDHLVVYVQWSSQIGGYCFIVPKNSVRYLDISIEEGMRWSLTAGLSAPESQDT
ncbi:DUF502 domain-containing protein [Desulfobacter latus]|jgi:uncharacterized membrane protein|uniref:DUF502 domain-containing protein n=1 Tax=Desulfobacter latus TaxID=2292 RepID=A0A850SU49_9BACT|nr:DUF502 domain-containing protein [Desulfobacter latus]NWH03540.1 DUF502 domain-containing protein [Desulfobacter latus]